MSITPNGPTNRHDTTRHNVSLANWSPQVGEQEMAQDMRAAFEEWAKYGNLKFVQVFTPDADIIVGFGSRHHGDKLSVVAQAEDVEM